MFAAARVYVFITADVSLIKTNSLSQVMLFTKDKGELCVSIS